MQSRPKNTKGTGECIQYMNKNVCVDDGANAPINSRAFYT